MRLEDVTALQAIEVICQAQGYDLTQTNGVYYVKTPAEKAAEPTQSEFYTFSYARAATVLPLLTSQLKAKGVTPQVDERTNTIFYQEAKSNVSTAIREFLARVDRPTRQVMIEARLVEVTSNPHAELRHQLGRRFRQQRLAEDVPYGGSSIVSEGPIECNRPASSHRAGRAPPRSTITPADGPDHRLGTVRSSHGLPARQRDSTPASPACSTMRSAARSPFSTSRRSRPRCASSTRTRTPSSSPTRASSRRTTWKATIKIVRNQPVPQLNFNEQTATAVFGGFQDKLYGNTLEVTPSINKDNFITLSVKPEISNHVGDQTFNFAGAAVTSPIIDTRTLEANVLIKSGCTLAIGGLLQDETEQGHRPRCRSSATFRCWVICSRSTSTAATSATCSSS